MNATASVPLLLGVALVGCGGSTETVAPPTTDLATSLSAAARQTLDADTAMVRLEFEHTKEGGFGASPGESDSTEGVVDFRARLVELRFIVDRLVVSESALYLYVGEGQEKPWRQYDLDKAPKGEFIPDMFFGRLEPFRLLTYLETIDNTGSEFEDLGEEAVRGETTTHIRGLTELDALMEHLITARFYPGLVWDPPLLGMVAIEAWIADDGRLRKIVYDFRAPTSGVALGERSTIELYDFGRTVSLEVPPSDQTVYSSVP